ncbi:MAG: hypothetical protein CMO69_00855 [Verrucomicrobiales bacterium]|nr:hypothetical protein [Verrucomicrobiales bacterium]
MFYPKDLIGLVILFNSHGSVALLIMLYRYSGYEDMNPQLIKDKAARAWFHFFVVALLLTFLKVLTDYFF